MRASAVRIGLAATALVFLGPAWPRETTKTLWSLASFGSNDFFHEPSDIEVDNARRLIYIIDAGSDRVLVFDFEGGFRRAFGAKGQGPGEFLRPTGAGLLPGGGLAVADHGNNRIQIFDPEGTPVRSIATTDARVADLVVADGRFYTVPSFGSSGYSVTLASGEKTQPLVIVLDDQGKKISELSIADFPEPQPFVRAIKRRVSLALSPGGRLFLPHYALNLVQVFETSGRKAGEFSRPLPFNPIVPALVDERSPEKGVVQMRAKLDAVSLAARFGPDGRLYILSATDSLMKRLEKPADLRDPAPRRVDVIDPDSFRVVGTLPCDPGAAAFGLMDGGRMVYIYEDAEGELALKCVRY